MDTGVGDTIIFIGFTASAVKTRETVTPKRIHQILRSTEHIILIKRPILFYTAYTAQDTAH